MGRYRKISVSIWNDQKFNRLSDDAQLLFFFVLTHPNMTSVGAMRTTLEGLAAEKDWPLERLLKAFKESESQGMIEFCKASKCLILPNFIKHNLPQSPNVIKGWETALDLIPECDLKYKQLQYIGPFIEKMSIKFRKAFESLLKAFAIQEQEQEQEQKQKQEQEQEQKQEQYIPPLTPPATVTVNPVKTVNAVKVVKKEPPQDAVVLYDFYIDTIDPREKTRQRSITNMTHYLKTYSIDDLKIAINNYAIIATEREQPYRKNPANFFGRQEKYFLDFLPGKFQPPATYSRPLSESDRRHMESRQIAQAYLRLKQLGAYDDRSKRDPYNGNEGADPHGYHYAGQDGTG